MGRDRTKPRTVRARAVDVGAYEVEDEPVPVVPWADIVPKLRALRLAAGIEGFDAALLAAFRNMSVTASGSTIVGSSDLPGWRFGVLAAAEVADGYNGSTTHEYRLGDCVAGKLNVGRAKPRKNRRKLQHPDAAWTCGIGFALAEVQRLHDQPTILVDVARAAGLTVADFKAAGLDAYDLKTLREHLPKAEHKKRVARR